MHDPALEELTGKSIWALMPAAERDAHRSAFERAMRTGEASPPVVLRSIYTKAGEYRMHEVHRRLILDSEGNPVGMGLVSFDMTEIEMARKGAQESAGWMNSVFESMAGAVLVIDALGFVRYVNPAGQALTGCKREALIGTQVEEGLPLVSFESLDGSALNFGVVLDSRWTGKATIRGCNRQQVRVEISSSPFVDREKGCTTGVVGVMRRAADSSASPGNGPDPDCDCGIVILE